MVAQLRARYAHLLTSGSQVLLLVIAAQSESRIGWLAGLALMALISVLAWLSALKRARGIDDMPTSRGASAAQGYVELRGSARGLAGLPVVSPLTGLPCLWYRYTSERRRDDKWVQEDHGDSDASFILDDGSGQCLVDPQGAEIMSRHHDAWQQGDHRYNQWLLLERDPLYVLGQFATRGSADLQLNANEDVKELLAEWKADAPSLLKRFDLDGDGRIDLGEWQLARSRAKREVAAAHREARAHAELNMVSRPADGRPYLVSNFDPDKLSRKYRLWSAVHLTFFFGSLAGVALTLGRG